MVSIRQRLLEPDSRQRGARQFLTITRLCISRPAEIRGSNPEGNIRIQVGPFLKLKGV